MTKKNTRRSLRLKSVHLASHRELSTEEDVTGDVPNDIFDDEDNDENNNATTPCVYADIYGDYGADNPYSDAAVVAWTYQIQGVIAMSANVVKTRIIPKVEELVSRLLVERLFQTDVCDDDDGDYVGNVATSARHGGNRELAQQRKLELQLWELSNGARVSGLLVEPKDSILPHFDGVNCRDTTYIPDAPRCFRLIGAVTLTGQNGNIDEAVNLTQAELETIFNDENLLSGVDEMVRNIQYMEAEPDHHVYFGGPDPNEVAPTPAPQPAPTPAPQEKKEDDDDDDSMFKSWPIWPWIVVGSCFVLCLVAIFALRQRNLGSFNAASQRRRKKHASLLSMQRSSDDSMDYDDDDDDDEEPYSNSSPEPYLPSQTWRNVPTPTSSKDDKNSTSDGSGGVRKPPAHAKNSTRYYSQLDAIQGRSLVSGTLSPVQGRSLATGSFPDSTNSNQLQFVDQTGKNMTSLDSFSSSNTSGGNKGNDSTSSGSSSPSSSSSTPPPDDRGWNKRHVI